MPSPKELTHLLASGALPPGVEKRSPGYLGKTPLPRSTSTFGARFLGFHTLGQAEIIKIVKRGVPAGDVSLLADRLALRKDRLIVMLGLGRSTVLRKAAQSENLTPDESSKVIGIARLVGQVEAMVEESGKAEGFDAAKWVGSWLEQPLPALGGAKPADFMDTPDGQQLVLQLLSRAQGASYS